MIINNENFNIGSKYRALSEIVSMEKEFMPIKTLGMWSCNISSAKLSEILPQLRNRVSSLEFSDLPKDLKKQAVKAISEIYLYQNYSQDDKNKLLSTLLIQRTPLSVKNLDLLLTYLTGTSI